MGSMNGHLVKAFYREPNVDSHQILRVECVQVYKKAMPRAGLPPSLCNNNTTTQLRLNI